MALGKFLNFLLDEPDASLRLGSLGGEMQHPEDDITVLTYRRSLELSPQTMHKSPFHS